MSKKILIILICGILIAHSFMLIFSDSIEGNIVSSGTWTRKKDMIYPRTFLAGANLDGKVYAIGGQWTNDMPYSTVMVYNPTIDSWHTKTSLNIPRTGLASVTLNGKIYAMGGKQKGHYGSVYSSIEIFDPVTDTWTFGPEMQTRRAFFDAIPYNNKIYAIGGIHYNQYGVVYLSSVEEFDPITNTWTYKSEMPTPRSGFAVAEVNGKIYVIGGIRAPDYLATVEIYDPISDKWSKANDMPTIRAHLDACSLNNLIYAIGGAPSHMNTVEIYDPLTDQWVAGMDMPTGRTGLLTVVEGDRIYAIGGADWFGYGRIVEEFGLITKIFATIDIDPNTIQLGGEGKFVTCYIELPKDYDVRDIEATTVLLEDTLSPELDPKYGFVVDENSYIVDEDEDSILERIIKFNRDDVEEILSPGTYNLKVTGELDDGTVFEGYSDEIKVIDPP